MKTHLDTQNSPDSMTEPHDSGVDTGPSPFTPEQLAMITQLVREGVASGMAAASGSGAGLVVSAPKGGPLLLSPRPPVSTAPY